VSGCLLLGVLGSLCACLVPGDCDRGIVTLSVVPWGGVRPSLGAALFVVVLVVATVAPVAPVGCVGVGLGLVARGGGAGGCGSHWVSVAAVFWRRLCSGWGLVVGSG
jgi:hypothetical protein